ncbi:substrate-binding periplasmic protein [Zooshikella ganghwensis]|uniref:Solute-binding protein family 3/N-terminal domain-containing protein n=1 Tax=Zooshikella ganghwensis TaxID=202772 RepID=A0A4P9VNK8_9GAMM|nr:transporter substrate-binding domain-containing protein [Zooshikella ganghwensis]RDH43700.1 hypothetical protein B9G39_09755 [Zooshikella ganghwensis]
MLSITNHYLKYFLNLLITYISIGILHSNALISDEIKLGTVHDFPPYSFKKEGQTLSGIDIEVVSEVFKQLNMAYSIQSFPVQRAQYLVQKEKLDGMLTTTPYITDKLSNTVWRSHSLYRATVSIFIHQKNKPALNQRLSYPKFCFSTGFLSSTSPKAVGLTQSDFIDVRLVQRLPQLVNLLTQQQVDCVIAEDISFIYQAKLMGKADQIFLLQELVDRESFIVLHQRMTKKNPQLGHNINQVIANLQRNDFIDNTIIKYLDLPLQSWKQ